MKKLLTILLLFTAITIKAQTHAVYVSPSFGPYCTGTLNTKENTLETLGYALEVGYSYKGMINAGVSYGTLDLSHKYPFLQGRVGFTFLERPAFSLTAAAGMGYCFTVNRVRPDLPKANSLISEGDFIANIYLPKNFDLTLAFANQYIVGGVGYQPAFNVGFSKTLPIKIKK